jgi:hypothetical protein
LGKLEVRHSLVSLVLVNAKIERKAGISQLGLEGEPLRSRHALLIAVSQKEPRRLEAVSEDPRSPIKRQPRREDARLGISRSWVHRLLQAYNRDGAGGLLQRSAAAEQPASFRTVPERKSSIWFGYTIGTSETGLSRMKLSPV